MTSLALLNAILSLANGLLSWLQNRQLIDAGKASAIALSLKATLDEIAKANDARNAARRDGERDPARLRDEDGFRRSD